MMITTAILVLLAGAPQDARKFTVDAKVFEAPGTAQEAPSFACEGTTDLPDGCRLDVYTYYGAADPGFHIKHTVAITAGGKFSSAFSMFEKKTLPGDYSFRVVFDPNLQAQRFGAFPAWKRDYPLRVGTPEEAEKARVALCKQLVADIKGIVAVADEATNRRKAEKDGKPDPAVWDPLLKAWYRKLADESTRVQKILEYRVLGLTGVVDNGFEHLCGIIMDITRCAARGQDTLAREGRERLDLMVSKFEADLTGVPANPRLTRIELTQNARRALAQAVQPQEDRGPTGRKGFRQAILDLNRLVTPEDRQTLLEISAAATELFDKAEEKKDVKEDHKKLDARLAELLQAYQNEK